MNMEPFEVTDCDLNQRAVLAAFEFARREAKGLPTDRLGSAEDMRLVAEGIRVLWGTCESLWADIQSRNTDAMKLHGKRPDADTAP